MKIVGECKQCGECCRTNDQWLDNTDEMAEFAAARGWKVRQRGKLIQAEAIDVCPHLTKDNKCGIYENRPRYCAGYPHNIDLENCKKLGLDPNKLLPGCCGYRFVDE